MKKHSKYSASASQRWINCPGSIKRSEDAPPQKESAAATEGTLAHTLMEVALNTNIKDVVSFFENDEETYPFEMRVHVQEFVTWVRSQVSANAELYIEEKTDCEFIHPDMGGTADVIILEPFGTLHVIDFKYGSGYVDHVNNTQMLEYAIGATYKNRFQVSDVKTTIYQPRGGKEVVRSYCYTLEEIFEWIKTFTVAVEACENADREKDLRPGAHCKYCPAAIQCPAISKNTLAKAKLDFATPVLPEGKELSPNRLKQILDQAEYLELWINEVKSYAESLLKSGGKIKGWGLVPTRPQRVWSNPKKINATIRKQLTLEYLASPAEAEKLLKAEGFKKEDIKKFMSSNVTTVSSGVKLSKTNNDYADTQLEIEDGD